MIELAPRPRALRILCVEENGLERKLLQACLDIVQIEAVFALTGTEAMAYFCRHPVDMVFIDIDRHTARELGCFRRMRAMPGRGSRAMYASPKCSAPRSSSTRRCKPRTRSH